MANIELNGVRVEPQNLLGKVDRGAEILDPVLDRGRCVLAAEMLGSLEEAFERTMEYIKQREQFDVPIGSFQALKHRSAEMFCEVELCKSVVLDALSAIDEGRSEEEIAMAASLAKAQVTETFNHISSEAVQLYGGIGMTDEEEIGFFLKRARLAAQILGDEYFHRNRFGQLEGY